MNMRRFRIRNAILAAGLCLGALGWKPAAAQPMLPMPSSGTMSFGNWHFSWEVGNANDEGLVLKNVDWKGTRVLYKASMPVIRVKYRGSGSSINSGCGPYSDRIHSGNLSHVKGQTTDVTARLFGTTLLEIAVFSEIGGYDLYQAYYFHTSGRLEPMLYSSGWSCSDDGNENSHKHHPYWRLDLDVGGTSNRASHALTVSGGGMSFASYSSESGFTAPSNTSNIVWTVKNGGNGKEVRLQSPSNERADGMASPWFGFGQRDVHVRRYHYSEDEGWDFGSNDQLGYFSPAETTQDQDLVFWSIGHLSHNWDPADVANPHWHSRGWILDAMW